MTDAPHFDTPVARAATAVILVGAATILGAWGFQMAGYVPCPLCLQQRIPYYAAVPIAFAAFFMARRMPGSVAPRALIAIVGVLFLVGTGLAAYHAGVEWKFWPGPSDCTATATRALSTGTLLENLNDVSLVRCDEAAWRLFGISLAGWNFVISLPLAILSLGAALRR